MQINTHIDISLSLEIGLNFSLLALKQVHTSTMDVDMCGSMHSLWVNVYINVFLNVRGAQLLHK